MRQTHGRYGGARGRRTVVGTAQDPRHGRRVAAGGPRPRPRFEAGMRRLASGVCLVALRDAEGLKGFAATSVGSADARRERFEDGQWIE